jgi:tetratricopeptide (TPR) repeat protein
MRIALCVSGQLRNFEATWEKSVSNLFGGTKKYDFDTYLDIWSEKGITTALDRIIPLHYLHYLIGELTVSKYSSVSLQKEYPILKNYLFKKETIDKDKLQKVFNATYINIEDSFKSFETEHRILDVTYPEHLIENSERSINCLPMFYKIYKCNEALIKSGKEYDFVIRMRPDFFLEKEINIPWEKIQNRLYVRRTSDRHCDDQFAMATPSIMNVYASLWNKLPKYWHIDNSDTNRLTSGSLLERYLSDNNIEIVRNDWPQMISSDRIQNDDLFLALVEQVECAGHTSDIKPIINFASEVYYEILMQIVNVSKDKLEALIKIESYIFGQCSKYKWMDLWQCKAFVSERKRDLYTAINFYTQALKNDPYSFYSYSGLARCYRALNKNKLACINYLAAHQIRSRDFFILRDFTSMLFELKKYDEALYYAQKAYVFNNQNKQLEDIISKIKQFI